MEKSKEKHGTPTKTTIVNKVLNHLNGCDSPFRKWPNFSTPPSRVGRIRNPFENHLLERLPFPTFSPTVFAQGSTPKTSEDNSEFKWSIDEISSLKPADIDEATLDQHVSDHDLAVDPLVQEKINYFFNSKVVVPSPIGVSIKTISMVPPSPEMVENKPEMTDGSAQTDLSLPPTLPKHVEEVLAPYFSYFEEERIIESRKSLYDELFCKTKDEYGSAHTSPAQSTGLSPLQLSPLNPLPKPTNINSSNISDELKDCILSPISKSTCRTNISPMTIDSSLRLPILKKTEDNNTSVLECSIQSTDFQQMSQESINNWDLEYANFEGISFKRVSSNDSNEILNTPHSKMFTSQRKRLSDSFKDIEMKEEHQQTIRKFKNRLFVDNTTDFGYETYERSEFSSSRMSTSTPTKDL